MKRQRETRFISRRSIVFSLTAMVLVGLLSALLAPVATGTSLRPEVSQANVEEAESDTSTSVLGSSRLTFADIQFREENWVIESGEPEELQSPAALSRNDIEYLQHNWDFTTGESFTEVPRGDTTHDSPDTGANSVKVNQSAARPPSSGEGVNDFRFIEENSFLPGSQSHTEEDKSWLPIDQGFDADGY